MNSEYELYDWYATHLAANEKHDWYESVNTYILSLDERPKRTTIAG